VSLRAGDWGLGAEGGLAGSLRPAFEWFHMRNIDLNGDTLLDKIHADDQTVPLPLFYEYAFCSHEHAALDPYAHAFDQVGMWIIGETVLNHRAHRSDLLIGHRHCRAVHADNASDTKSFQHYDFIEQSKIAKKVTAKQWDLNILDTVLPDTALAP